MARQVARIGCVAAYLVCLCMLVVGVALNLPWLIAENQRLEPWKLPLVWASEGAALWLFMKHSIRHVVSGTCNDFRHDRLSLRTFLIATCLDVVFSIASMVQEDAAYSRAVRAEAQVVRGSSRVQRTGHKTYSFACTFRARNGGLQSGWFSLTAEETPNGIQRGIDRGRFPIEADVLYDPRWPGRNWLASVPYSHDNRLFLFTLMSLMFSGLLTLGLMQLRREFPSLPPAGVGPLLGATYVLCFAAFLQGW